MSLLAIPIPNVSLMMVVVLLLLSLMKRLLVELLLLARCMGSTTSVLHVLRTMAPAISIHGSSRGRSKWRSLRRRDLGRLFVSVPCG
jgi:hypothetical protein